MIKTKTLDMAGERYREVVSDNVWDLGVLEANEQGLSFAAIELQKVQERLLVQCGVLHSGSCTFSTT